MSKDIIDRDQRMGLPDLINLDKDVLFQKNKMIAEFMGIKMPPEDPMDLKEITYHSSWELLFGVIEKIRNFQLYDGKRLVVFGRIHFHISSTGYEWNCSILGDVTICHNENVPHHYDSEKLDPSIHTFGNSDDKKKDFAIVPVYSAVVEFIKWFNKIQREKL